MTEIGSITFSAPLIEEGSWGERPVGEHASTMRLYRTIHPRQMFIEWEIPDLDMEQHIGLWFNDQNELIDYDGVMSLPKQAVKLLLQHGYTCPEEE